MRFVFQIDCGAMLDTSSTKQNIDPLRKSNAHFSNLRGPDLLARIQPYSTWIDARHDAGFWPYSRLLGSKPTPEARIGYLASEPRSGVNLAVQDYLGLATHPAIQEAAISAVTDFGVHSAGSPMLLGNSPISYALERKISELLALNHVLLFPTGWAAGYGVVTALIRDDDHIVMDALSHACLQAGAAAATKNIVRHGHLNVDKAEAALKAIRAKDSKNGILVMSEGLFSMDSDSPDLARLQEICKSYQAILLIDVAHDLGSLGPGGGGQLAIQNMLGKVDVVIGAFSKTFASNGGFVASNDTRVKQYLRWFASSHTFSNALSPIQCAIVGTAIDIVRSVEGEELRRRLLVASASFRANLAARKLNTLGFPSAIVPVLVGAESMGRFASKVLGEANVFANLVEFPAVARGSARFRCQLMAQHTEEQLHRASNCIADSIECASEKTLSSH